jgi:hypothetical protein
MYSELLPDPTTLPGVVGQLAEFTFIGLAYYDVGGVGAWAAELIVLRISASRARRVLYSCCLQLTFVEPQGFRAQW